MGPLRQLGARDLMLAWFGAVGSAVAWGVHLTGTYWYAEGACQNDNAVSSLTPVVIVLTAVLGAVAVLSGLAAFATWRGSSRGSLFDPRNRLAFMGAAGTVAGVVFTFAILLEGLLAVLIDGCAPS